MSTGRAGFFLRVPALASGVAVHADITLVDVGDVRCARVFRNGNPDAARRTTARFSATTATTTSSLAIEILGRLTVFRLERRQVRSKALHSMNCLAPLGGLEKESL